MNEIKPIYIMTILLVPIFLNLSINGISEGKAYLRYIILEGNISIIINLIEICISMYFINKFCKIYRELFNLNSLIKAYVKIFFSPFGFSLITMLLFDLYGDFIIYNNMLRLFLFIVLLLLNYLFLIIIIKRLVIKFIEEKV